MTPSELAEHCMKERQRQPEPSTSSTPYRSSQARGKAIKKVKQFLSFSP